RVVLADARHSPLDGGAARRRARAIRALPLGAPAPHPRRRSLSRIAAPRRRALGQPRVLLTRAPARRAVCLPRLGARRAPAYVSPRRPRAGGTVRGALPGSRHEPCRERARPDAAGRDRAAACSALLRAGVLRAAGRETWRSEVSTTLLEPRNDCSETAPVPQ